MNDYDSIFAVRFSSPAAIDSLIPNLRRLEHVDCYVNESLALNRHLSSTQIMQLLKMTGQVENGQVQKGISRDPEKNLCTGILIASRRDLTSEHLWYILKGKNKLLKHALLSPAVTRAGKAALNLEMVTYLVGRSWFTKDYIHLVYQVAHKFRLSKASLSLLQAKHQELCLQGPVTLTWLASPEHLTNWSSTTFLDFANTVNHVRRYSHYNRYLDTRGWGNLKPGPPDFLALDEPIDTAHAKFKSRGTRGDESEKDYDRFPLATQRVTEGQPKVFTIYSSSYYQPGTAQ